MKFSDTGAGGDHGAILGKV